MNKFFVVVIGLLAPMMALAAPVPDDLAGEWMFGALSFTNSRDASTGRLADVASRCHSQTRAVSRSRICGSCPRIGREGV